MAGSAAWLFLAVVLLSMLRDVVGPGGCTTCYTINVGSIPIPSGTCNSYSCKNTSSCFSGSQYCCDCSYSYTNGGAAYYVVASGGGNCNAPGDCTSSSCRGGCAVCDGNGAVCASGQCMSPATSGNACTGSCGTGYYAASGATSSVQGNYNLCAVCSASCGSSGCTGAATSCLNCATGYYMTASPPAACSNCSTSCGSSGCTGAATSCLNCATGYTLAGSPPAVCVPPEFTGCANCWNQLTAGSCSYCSVSVASTPCTASCLSVTTASTVLKFFTFEERYGLQAADAGRLAGPPLVITPNNSTQATVGYNWLPDNGLFFARERRCHSDCRLDDGSSLCLHRGQ